MSNLVTSGLGHPFSLLATFGMGTLLTVTRVTGSGGAITLVIEPVALAVVRLARELDMLNTRQALSVVLQAQTLDMMAPAVVAELVAQARAGIMAAQAVKSAAVVQARKIRQVVDTAQAAMVASAVDITMGQERRAAMAVIT